MRNKITNNVATIAFILFLIVGTTYSLYAVVFEGPSKAARSVNTNLIIACETNKARSQVFQDFALEAAAARRRNADHLSDQGDKIGALNEIATAKKYEGFANRYNKLTVHDCEAAYPNP